MNNVQCVCNFREDDSFKSSDDFHNHKNFVLKSEIFTTIEVKTFFSANNIETWHKCNTCFKVWRLVKPDVPFRGDWSVVPEIEL